MRPKILLVINSIETFFSHRITLAARLREFADLKIVLPRGNGNSSNEIEIKGFKCLTFPLSRKGIGPLNEFRSLFGLYRIYLKEQPDLIHHFTIKPVIYGTLAAWVIPKTRVVNTITGLGYVFTDESSRARIIRKIVLLIYRIIFKRKNQQIIFQNLDDEYLFRDFNIISNKNLVTLISGSGVDVSKFFPPLARTESSIPVVLFPARLLKDKGIYELFEATEQCIKMGYKFEVWLAGDIDVNNPNFINQEVLDLWCKKISSLKVLGKTKNMAELYRKIDIVCLPSYREGTSMSLLEAMASGLPIVTTRVPGCKHLVVEGKNGFLCEAKNVTDLSIALSKCFNSIQDKNWVKECRNFNRKIAEQNYSSEVIIKQIIATYLLPQS